MTTALIAKSAGLDLRAANNWLDARSALAFQNTEMNRLWEAHARQALGSCVCGKAGTHVFADEESNDWACRVPMAVTR